MLVAKLKQRLVSKGLPCEGEYLLSVQPSGGDYVCFTCKYGTDKNEITCLMKEGSVEKVSVKGPQAEALKDFCLNELNKEKWMKQLEMYPCPACGKNTLEPQCPIDKPEFYVACTNCKLSFPASESLTISRLFVVDGGEYVSQPLCKVKNK